MRRALAETDRLVVTIFVNPKQFNDPNDFQRYPSTIEADLSLCERVGAEIVYLPAVDSVYPSDFATNVHIAGVGDDHEGRSRPGHFDGVSTIVSKLLIAAEADVAVFGQKDYQQVAVVRRLVADLDIPTRVVVEPTVRDSDGLALSSRNVRLGPDARQRALAIPRSLDLAGRLVASGVVSVEDIESEVFSELRSTGLDVDYATVVDRGSLERPTIIKDRSVLLVAVTVDGVRLIDNIEL